MAGRFFNFLLAFVLLLCALGLPLDTPWKAGVFFVLMAYGAVVAGRASKWAMLAAVTICLLSHVLKMMSPVIMIDEGANVFTPENQALKQLPQPVYDHLSAEFQKLYPNHKLANDGKLYGFSVERFHHKSSLSRKVRNVDFSHHHEGRFGFMNTKPYNTYRDAKPHRSVLPYFVRYDVPEKISANKNTRICWKGDLFVKVANGFVRKSNPREELECFKSKEYMVTSKSSEPFVFYGTFVNPENPLAIKMNLPVLEKIYRVFDVLVTVVTAFIIAILLFSPLRAPEAFAQTPGKKYEIIILMATLVFSVVMAMIYRPLFGSGYILFEGGNDALSYSHAARSILEALYYYDWKAALIGTEKIYDLMPWHRYTYALNLFLFGDTHLGYFVTVLFFPLVIYHLLKKVLYVRFAFYMALCFAMIPIFESFGFTQMYMVRLCMRGFAEPLSYMFFFMGMAIGIDYLKKLGEEEKHSLFQGVMLGLCMAMAVGLRPNVAPGAGVFLAFVGIVQLRRRGFLEVLMMVLGFSPLALIPLHNYYFGDAFVLFTIAGQKSVNLALQLSDYAAAFKGFFSLTMTPEAVKIGKHLTTEINPKYVWLYVAMILNFYALFAPSVSSKCRVVALTGLAQLAVVLFYNVGGRYGYLHWSLLLITVFILCHEKYFEPRALKKKAAEEAAQAAEGGELAGSGIPLNHNLGA